jgi:hypothetical protein
MPKSPSEIERADEVGVVIPNEPFTGPSQTQLNALSAGTVHVTGGRGGRGAARSGGRRLAFYATQAK